MLLPSLDIRRDDYDYALAGKMIGIWRMASGLMLHGDYYPHAQFKRSAREWVAWQFDSPEEGRGFIQGIRLPESQENTFTIHPKALSPGATYLFDNPETGETRNIAGKNLERDGFTFELPARSGAVWFYKTQDAAGAIGACEKA